MSVLSLIQHVCGRTNVPVPLSVNGNPDTKVVQMLKLLDEEGTDLSKRGDWEGLINEATHTTLAAEDQGAMATIAVNGFRYIKYDTLWDRTDRLPVALVGSNAWQAMKAMASTGPRYRYRLRGGKMLVNPAPTAGHTWAFEYVSKNWILGFDGTTYKQYITQDDDTILLPEDLVLQGLRWRWKREKGLDYAEDFATYEQQVKMDLSRDGGKETLYMDGGDQRARPGIWVPDRSWSL